MDIKELKKFENYLLEKHSVDVDDLIGIKFVEDENEYKIVGAIWAVELEDACTELNVGWDAWQAAKASAVPDGYCVVPKVPTPKMIDATWDYDDAIQDMSHNTRNEFIYKAMIEAAQEQDQ